MAPLSVVLIAENLSQKQGEPFSLKECLSRSKAASVGVFVMGFSAGSATQVHFRNYIPRFFRAFLVLPLLSGFCGAYMAHDYFRNNCIRQWILSDQTPFNPRYVKWEK